MSTISPEEMQYYLDHANDNKQPNLIATCVLCMFLPAIAVFLRFFSRWRSQAGFKADDWLILFALVRPLFEKLLTFGIAMRSLTGMVCTGTNGRYDHHHRPRRSIR